jgi:hypothetical protein
MVRDDWDRSLAYLASYRGKALRIAATTMRPSAAAGEMAMFSGCIGVYCALSMQANKIFGRSVLTLGQLRDRRTCRLIFRPMLLCALLLVTVSSFARTIPVGRAVENAIKFSRLTDPGSPPFHFSGELVYP